MVWPSTKWLPMTRMACRVAARTAGRPDALGELAEDALRRLAGLDDAGGDAERPGGGRDEEGVRLRLVAGEVALAELVLDQPVGGGCVRHAQQRLGQHHQGEPLLGRERVFAQHLLDAAEAAAPRADRLDQARRRRVDARLPRRARDGRVGKEPARDRGVVLGIGGIEDRGGAASSGMGVLASRSASGRYVRPRARFEWPSGAVGPPRTRLFAFAACLTGSEVHGALSLQERCKHVPCASRCPSFAGAPLTAVEVIVWRILVVRLLTLSRCRRRHGSRGLAAPAAAPRRRCASASTGAGRGRRRLFAVALDKGYFKAEGLDVTIDPAAGSREPISRVASGTYDMGFGDVNSLVRFRDENPAVDIKAVMIIYDRPPFAIIGRKSRGITKDVASLAGKQVRRAGGGRRLRAMADLQGRQQDRRRGRCASRMSAFPVREPMLAQGEVDAVFGFSMSSYINLKSRGVPADDIVVMLMSDYGVDLYGNAILVSPKFAAEKPEAVKGFLRALVKGVHDTMKDPSAAVDSRHQAQRRRQEGRRARTPQDGARPEHAHALGQGERLRRHRQGALREGARPDRAHLHLQEQAEDRGHLRRLVSCPPQIERKVN